MKLEKVYKQSNSIKVMNKELKILKIMKKDGLTWSQASKKQKEIKTLEDYS